MDETRVCQNCKGEFKIDASDFDFYKKIDVPPPTFCPECRNQRRMSWRNERTFHRGKCAATGKDFLTMFSPEAKMTVYDRDYWWSDKWDQLSTGRDYDFSRPFFEQYAELLHTAPLPNLANSNCVNSEWGNHSLDCKNTYLFYASIAVEDGAYITGGVTAKNSFDIYKALNIIDCYEDILCADDNRLFFSYDSDQSIQSEFLLSCINMQDSLACINMKNGSHCIFNKHYSKEDYKNERAKYDLGSYAQLEKFKKEFTEFIKGFPRRYATILKSVDVSGDAVLTSKNCRHVFDIYGGVEDTKYLYHGATIKDSYDGYGMGAVAELMYEAVDAGAQARHCMFGVFTHGSQETSYTYTCHSSSNLFGCVGLRSKQYCILNKQYTKEEYEALLPKIKQQMKDMPYVDTKGRLYGYGEFFPTEISPFAYNETIAQEYFSLSKQEAESGGYSWHESGAKHYTVTIKAADLPDHIRDAPDSITKEIIECAHAGKCNQQCTSAFRIIPSELQFLKHFNIALPRLCPNCRHYERLAKRNPFRLWKRDCECAGLKSAKGGYENISAHPHGENTCEVKFETPYSPERTEIIYCEQCYQQEVV